MTTYIFAVGIAAVSLYFEMGGAPPPTSSQQEAKKRKKWELPQDLPEPDSEAAKKIADYASTRGLALPGRNAFVSKEECSFSFDTVYATSGLYVNLETFHAVGKEYLDLDVRRSGREEQIYLFRRWEATEEDTTEEKTISTSKDVVGEPALKKSKGEATHESSKTQASVTAYLKEQHDAEEAKKRGEGVKKTRRIVLVPSGVSLPYPYRGIPDALFQLCEELLHCEDGGKKAALEEFTSGDDEIVESKYAKNLVIAKNGVRISPDPKTWKCAESGMTENLWLNLSDGYIGSGRKQWGGLGGTGAALKHYKEMKAKGFEYPLVVKLGTITADGADVYSYAADEDRAVKDPWLAEHLAARGINIMECVKTEKTTQEMELDASLKMDLFNVDADGKKLERLVGPGLIGLANLGNTCYMNSCLQLFFSVPDIRDHFVKGSDQYYSRSSSQPSNDLATQLSKLAVGLTTDAEIKNTKNDDAMTATSSKEADDGDDDDVAGVSVRPRMFKNLIGKNHSQFSTNKQQDALEFWQHLMSKLETSESTKASAIQSLFEFQAEKRLECAATGRVQYKYESQTMLGLNPGQCLESAINRDDVRAYEKAKKEWDARKSGEGHGAKDEEPPSPVVPIVTFEACVAQKLAKSSIDGWTSPATGKIGVGLMRYRMRTFPKYLLVVVWRWFTDSSWVPRKLDVDVDMPKTFDLDNMRATGRQAGEQPLQAPRKTLQPDPSVVSAVVSMGFSQNAGKRAAIATKNVGPNEAVNWVLANMTLSDLNDPIVEEKATSDDHGGVSSSSSTSGPGVGSSKYVLVGLITHQGKNAGHGHYVCQAMRSSGGDVPRWVLFNDRKVTKPGSLLIKKAYMYLYRQE